MISAFKGYRQNQNKILTKSKLKVNNYKQVLGNVTCNKSINIINYVGPIHKIVKSTSSIIILLLLLLLLITSAVFSGAGKMGDIGQTGQEGCTEDHQQEEGAGGFPTEVSTSRARRDEDVGTPTHHQVVRHLVY